MNMKTKFSGSIPQGMKQFLTRDTEKLLKQYSFSEVELAMTAKTQEQKKLVEVHANLYTDKGRFHASGEGFNLGEVCADTLEHIKAQLKKQTI